AVSAPGLAGHGGGNGARFAGRAGAAPFLRCARRVGSGGSRVVMDEARYNGLIAGVWKRILAATDAIDPDGLDAVATGDRVTPTPSSGEKVVVNTQRAVRQIWVAGKGLGIHFSLGNDGRWMDDKGKGIELYAWVSECVQAVTGESLQYA